MSDIKLKYLVGLIGYTLYENATDYISTKIFKNEHEPTSFLDYEGNVIGYQPPTIEDRFSEYDNVIDFSKYYSRVDKH